MVVAYDAIIVVKGTLTSPNSGAGAVTGYSPRLRIYSSSPASGASAISDTSTRYDNQAFSSVQSLLVQLSAGAKYYITMTFAQLCSKYGREFRYASKTCGDCGGAEGGCWGACTSDDYNNFKRNTVKITSPCTYDYIYHYTCREYSDMTAGACNAQRSDGNNPVSATVTSPGPAIFGDDDVLFEFTAP